MRPKMNSCPPGGNGYQNVGRVIEVGPDVNELQIGDVLYMSAIHAEYVVIAEDDLLFKATRLGRPHGGCAFRDDQRRHAYLSQHRTEDGGAVLIVGAGIIGQVAGTDRSRYGSACHAL